MSPHITVQRDGSVCRVSGSLDFFSAKSALEQLGALVSENEQLDVSFGDVTSANSAGLALMIELKGIAHRAGHQLRFTDVPDGLQQLAKVCQVDTLLA